MYQAHISRRLLPLHATKSIGHTFCMSFPSSRSLHHHQCYFWFMSILCSWNEPLGAFWMWQSENAIGDDGKQLQKAWSVIIRRNMMKWISDCTRVVYLIILDYEGLHSFLFNFYFKLSASFWKKAIRRQLRCSPLVTCFYFIFLLIRNWPLRHNLEFKINSNANKIL